MTSLLLQENSAPGIVEFTLNRPDKRNALSIALIEELTAAIRTAEADKANRVLIIKGNGPSFCAGLDLAEAGVEANASRSATALCGLYEIICNTPLVVIVVGHGGAFGGGAGMIAAADLVVASDDLKIGFPEVRRGLVAALVTVLLRRHLGDRAVRELILLGRTLDAAQTMQLGLATTIVPHADALGTARGLAREILTGAPGAISRTKTLLDEMAPRPASTDLHAALAYHLDARKSMEAKEGVAAFLEKRAPVWGPRE